MDVTEIQTQRPKKNQKIDYSGKKKKHREKIEIRIQADGKIMTISKVYAGKTHDFKIRKSEKLIPRNVRVLADSGYQGLQKVHQNTVIPHKRRQKTPLTPESKHRIRFFPSGE